jgi:hypothetical protein
MCHHCDKRIEAPAYRVTSEEADVILLEMIVCHLCSEQAKDLGLDVKSITTREIK